MKTPPKAAPKPPSAQQLFDALLAKVNPTQRALLVSVRKALSKRFPTANELVYDYPRALVIGYSPNENGVDAVVALSASADGLRLYFLNGPKLPDPTGSLLGSGKQTRYVEIESLKTLKRPEVKAFLVAVVELAKTPLSPSGRGQLVIKTSSAAKAAKKKAAKAKPSTRNVSARKAPARKAAR